MIPLAPRGHLGTEGVKEEAGGSGGTHAAHGLGPSTSLYGCKTGCALCGSPPWACPPGWGSASRPQGSWPPLAQPHPQILSLERWSPR